MAAFQYTALDERGKQQRGVLEADSVRQIRQLLRDKGLVPLDVSAAAAREQKESSSMSWFSRRLGALDRVMFTRQMATLVAAGLPIEEALQAVAQQSEKPHVGALVMGIRSRVLEGHSLAASLAEYSNSFSQMYRSTVASGEQSGRLDGVLENLADYTEQQFESSRNVQMAMFYPVILFVLALLIVGGLMVYVVPDMVGVIENMGRELPAMTRVLIACSEFMVSYWWAVLALFIGLIVLARWALARPGVRLRWDRAILEWPLVGRIARAANTARYANTISILAGSGVPLVEAMRIASQVVANTWLQRRLDAATVRVSEGASLRASLEGVGYLPPMLLHMVASGEASGELDTMLRRVAQYQNTDVNRIVTTLVRLIEPLMYLLMGGLVLFIVMAVLLPILNMNQLV